MSEAEQTTVRPGVRASLAMHGWAYRVAQSAADAELRDLRAAIATAYRDGMTISDIAEVTGMSRQAVSRALASSRPRGVRVK